MERQHRAITHKFHEIEQGIHRVTACSNGRRPQAMQQYAGAQSAVGTLQGTFKRLAQVDRAVFNDHCTHRQHLIAVKVQAAGLQVHHDPALRAQWRLAQRRGGRQLLQALLLFKAQQRLFARQQPGQQAHS